MSDVGRIGPANVDGAAATLVAAFADDPVFLWLNRDRPIKDGPARGAFREIIGAELRKDRPEVFATDGDGSVAIWHGIDEWKGSVVESIRALPSFTRALGLGVTRAFRVLAIMEKVHPTEPHYHLAYVGTHPDQQGRGLGTAVLQPMLERCDTEGVPAYLENSKPRNEAFYVRHGFVNTGPIPLPDGAPPVMGMWREPR